MLRLALLGDPVSHSLSPAMHMAAMRAMGIDGDYIAMSVSADEFEEKLHELRQQEFAGANVTIPHKALARRLAAKADDASRVLGVANTLRFGPAIACKNTDAPGFLEALGEEEPGVALIIGAGGSARAAIWALSNAGWKVKVWSRTYANSLAACAWKNVSATPFPNPAGCGLVVNATPLGLNPGELPPGEWRNLQPGCVVFDLAYRSEPTDLLKLAESLGARTVDGREMLVAQGALSLGWWSERRVPKNAMRVAVGLPPKE